jgi:uncharacterized paraquat-inducible protein A
MSPDQIVLCEECGAGCPGNATKCVRCGSLLASPPENPQPVTAKVVMVILFLVLGIAGETMLFIHMSRAKASQSWPKVEGTILGAGVKGNVEYGYVVNNIDYTCRRVTYKRGATRSTGYKKGDTVDVYYDPDDPSIAVLLPGFAPSSYVVVGIMIFAVFFLIPLLQARLIIKVRARSREPR